MQIFANNMDESTKFQEFLRTFARNCMHNRMYLPDARPMSYGQNSTEPISHVENAGLNNGFG